MSNVSYENDTVNVTLNVCIDNITFYDYNADIYEKLNQLNKNGNIIKTNATLTKFNLFGKSIIKFGNISYTVYYNNGSIKQVKNVSSVEFDKTGILIMNGLDINIFGKGTTKIYYNGIWDSVNGYLRFEESNVSKLQITINKLKIMNKTMKQENTYLVYGSENKNTTITLFGIYKKIKEYDMYDLVFNTIENNETVLNTPYKIDHSENTIYAKQLKLIVYDNKTHVYVVGKIDYKNVNSNLSNGKYNDITTKIDDSYISLRADVEKLTYKECYYFCLNSSFESCVLDKCVLNTTINDVSLNLNGTGNKTGHYLYLDVITNTNIVGYLDETTTNLYYVFYSLPDIKEKNETNKKAELTFDPNSIYHKVTKDTEFSKDIKITNIGDNNAKILDVYLTSDEKLILVKISSDITGDISPGETKYLKLDIDVKDDVPEGTYYYTLNVKTSIGLYQIPITIDVVDNSEPIDNILDLEVKVICSGGTLEDGTCVINKGMNYTVTIKTTIKEVKFFVAAGFKLESIIKNVDESSGTVTYTAVVKATKNTVLSTPPVWVPKVSGYGSKIELGITPPSDEMYVFDTTKGSNTVTTTPSYEGIHLEQIYYVTGIKEEKVITSTVSSTTNVPGGYFDIVATIKNKDDKKYIYDVNLNFSSNLEIGFGKNCNAELCIEGIPVENEFLPPGGSITRTYRVYANYDTPIGTHTITLSVRGYVNKTLLKDSETVTFKVVSPPKLSMTASVYDGTPAVPGEIVTIKGTITNDGDYPIKISLDEEKTYNFEIKDCTIVNPVLGPHSSTDFVCYGATQKPGDGLVIFKVYGSFKGYTISNLKDLVIEGAKNVGLVVTPNKIDIPNIKPGETYTILLNVTNTGDIPLYMKIKFNDFAVNLTDEYNCSIKDWVTFTCH